MNEKQAVINSIKNTLATLEITATEGNLEKLLACQRALTQLREEVADDVGTDSDSE